LTGWMEIRLGVFSDVGAFQGGEPEGSGRGGPSGHEGGETKTSKSEGKRGLIFWPSPKRNEKGKRTRRLGSES